jgi:hypothetical protein
MEQRFCKVTPSFTALVLTMSSRIARVVYISGLFICSIQLLSDTAEHLLDSQSMVRSPVSGSSRHIIPEHIHVPKVLGIEGEALKNVNQMSDNPYKCKGSKSPRHRKKSTKVS